MTWNGNRERILIERDLLLKVILVVREIIRQILLIEIVILHVQIHTGVIRIACV